MPRLTVPDTARQTVPVEQVADKQKMLTVKLKNGKERQVPRFMVRLLDDGKTATMTDTQHPDYLKYQEKRAKFAKSKIKLDKTVYQARLDRQRAIGVAEGKKLGVKEFRESKLDKLLDVAYRKGLIDGKPQVNKLERAAKLEEQARTMAARAEKLKAEAQKAMPKTAAKPKKAEKKAPKPEARTELEEDFDDSQ